MATNGNTAVLYIPKPGNQSRNRSFSAARRADNRSHASLRNGKTHVIQNRITIFIGKGNMVKGNIKGIQRDVFAIFINSLCLLDTFYPVKRGIQHTN